MKSPNSPCSNLVVAYFLEHIQEQGNSTYIAEGELRASHRLLREAPYEDFGLPGNNDFQTELQPIPAYRPIELVFALRPTAWQFAKGVRVTIAFADAGNFGTPILDPAPMLQILRNKGKPSYVDLPIIQYP